MGILAAYAVPHPPLIVPSVGRGEERGIQNTVGAYREVARRIVELSPETVVVTSPHAPLYRDAFHVTTDAGLSGSMARFGAPRTRVDAAVDGELASEIVRQASLPDATGTGPIPVAGSTWRDREMDHATFIPLWFVDEALREAGRAAGYRIVRIGLSGLSFETHRAFGRVVARAVAACGRRVVLVASGDLSHKLKEDGPYGFAPEGPAFDARIAEIFRTGDLDALFGFDGAFCDAAAECGLRSFQIMAGALEEEARRSGGRFGAELLSCEGPFGVGYAVAAFEREAGTDAGAETAAGKVAAGAESGPEAAARTPQDAGTPGSAEVDSYVALARASVEGFVRTGRPIARPDGLPTELVDERAGVFVSLHEDGDLRGCIGTIGPTMACMADEIIRNGVAACSEDPRFPPVSDDELDFLEISVDVLAPAEPVASETGLDPARYGVIVTKGWRRGLLLPNLEGVDTVRVQVDIAKRKAGIGLDERGVRLERFEVVRHERGGEARRVRPNAR